ncbi:NAD(P)-dependent oxidoreductase [Actinomycetes bacterium M1A6_2h]
MQDQAVYTDVDDLDSAPGVALLEANGFRVTVLETRDPSEIVEAARDASVLMVGYACITAEMIAALPRLRLIALLSTGFDNVDVAAATAAGVQVSTVGHIATEEVAAHAWALTTALTRRLPFFAGAGTARGWIDRPRFPPLRMSALTVGVVGMGRIGQEYARIALSQAGTVLGHDRSSKTSPGVEPVDLDALLSRSDVVSLHVPGAVPAVVDDDFLERMKPGSYLINVSRGSLVDSAALARSLDACHLAGAGIDTLDVEPPPPGHPLLGHPSVLLSPHVAYLSDVSARAYIETQAANAVAWSKTGSPLNSVQVMA